MRESFIANSYNLLYISYLMVFLGALTKNTLMSFVAPAVVLLMHTTITDPLFKSDSKMNLNIIDFLVVYSVAFLMFHSNLFSSLFGLLRRMVSLALGCFVDDKTVEGIYSWAIPLG